MSYGSRGGMSTDTAAFAALLNELRGPLTGVAAVSCPVLPLSACGFACCWHLQHGNRAACGSTRCTCACPHLLTFVCLFPLLPHTHADTEQEQPARYYLIVCGRRLARIDCVLSCILPVLCLHAHSHARFRARAPSLAIHCHCCPSVVWGAVLIL